jgi:broad specificity phosphatase PhoE
MSARRGAKPGASAQREEQVRGQPRPRITLLRHGEPDWAPGGGPTVNDPGLTDFGHEQAQVAAKALAAEAIDAIYVSPLTRAQQTAAPVAAAAGVTPVTIDDLAEIGINFEGKGQEEVDRIFVEASRRPLSEHWEGWPGGETFTDFHARVTRGITEVLARHDIRPDKKHDFTVWHLPPGSAPHIVIVAHGGTNAVLLTHLLDVPAVPWEWLRYESALCAYSISHARPLGEQGHVWSLQNFNELDHLRAAGLL